MFVLVATPAGSTQELTQRALDDVANYLLHDENAVVDSVLTVNGFSFAGRGQNSGLIFVRLRDYAQRKSEHVKIQALVGRTFGRFAGYRNALVFPVNPPSIPELGTAAGFDFELQDRADLGHAKLMEACNMLLGMAAHDPMLAQVRLNGLNDTAQFKVNIDREKAAALGVTSSAIDQTFSIRLGVLLCEQLPRHRQPDQEGVPARGCAVPHDAGQHQRLVCAQYVRLDGAVLRIHIR